MRIRKQLVPFVAVGVFLVLAAIGTGAGWMLAGDGDNKSALRPSSSPAVSPSPSPPTAGDFWSRNACQLADNWRTSGKPVDYEVIERIADSASLASNFDVKFEGEMLHRAVELAKASKGASDHSKRVSGMVTALEALDAECVAAGIGYS